MTAQSAPASTGGRSSKSGTPCPGTYSPRWSSSSVVFGAMRTFTPARCAVSTISSTAASSKSPSCRITSSGFASAIRSARLSPEIGVSEPTNSYASPPREVSSRVRVARLAPSPSSSARGRACSTRWSSVVNESYAARSRPITIVHVTNAVGIRPEVVKS